MTHPDFWEVGASGRRYSREFVLDTLESRLPDPDEDKWVTSDFLCREIGADNYLITYTLAQGQRITRRATLWRRTKGAGRLCITKAPSWTRRRKESPCCSYKTSTRNSKIGRCSPM